MSNKVAGLNDKAFELAFRLFEEYRSRREKQEQYQIEQRQRIEYQKTLPAAEEPACAPEEDVYLLEDILSTFDDEKRKEFEAFVDLLPMMIEERHGLCTGLDGKTIDDALTKDVSGKDVMKYVASDVAKNVGSAVSSAAACIAGIASYYAQAASCAVKQYTKMVYHGFWPAASQVDAALTDRVEASPSDMTLANANAQIATGIGATWGVMGYIYYIQEMAEGYSGDYSDIERAMAVGLLGTLIAAEGFVRRTIAEKCNEPCGSSLGVLFSIPSFLKDWYSGKKREFALKRLKVQSEEGHVLLGYKEDKAGC